MPLTDQSKSLCFVFDFDDIQTRIVTRVHSGLTLPPGYAQIRGAVMLRGTESKLDFIKASATIGDVEFRVPDADESVTALLVANDNVLSGLCVTLRYGIVGEAEAGYTSSKWLLDDYRIDGDGGGYVFKLVNVYKPSSKPLYEEFDGESHQLLQPLTASSNAITLERFETSELEHWRQPGYACLVNTQTKTHELIQYTSITSTQNQTLFEGLTRAVHGVDGSDDGAWATESTSAVHVWVRRGNPVDIVLALLTTTDDGTNGAYDDGSGDGLGIDVSLIDVAGFESLRDNYWPAPTFGSDGNLLGGTGMLFVETKPIDDVRRFVEENIFAPLAIKPVMDSQERLSVTHYFDPFMAATDVGGKWVQADFRASQWRRDFKSVLNQFKLETDSNVASEQMEHASAVSRDTSIARYGESKPHFVTSKGARTGRMGFPDYYSLDDMREAVGLFAMETTNPWQLLGIQAFFEFADLSQADAITLDVPVIPNFDTGKRGIVGGRFYVDGKRLDARTGRVSLTVRQDRRPFDRAAIYAPDAHPDYSVATDADKQYAYIAPDSGTFADGTDAYRIV